ncbi:MAG: tryptophan--tRNA ligase [Elusimicrobia bacterium CG08_land_8_20_14_0_20_59_10]|nr:MAG: tryptophan--tRNA ligase [Elusimicrobia bacterium CG08_land_8_20_14_0_20_59_10]
MENEKKAVVVSGNRPTGRLHLGNYWGTLKNWVSLQDKYDCYFFVADWHALTTGTDKSESIAANTREMVLDWLALGLDPAKCVLFRQSDVKAHAELSLLLGMVTPISWLLRNPTFKEQLQELYKQKYKGQEDKMKKAEGVVKQLAEAHGHDADELALHSDMAVLGFLGYPVLQAADILLYGAEHVPIGRDQLPHLELSRDIARRFNHVFGCGVFKEPGPLLTSSPVVPGLDGRKMSKSYGNTILLGEEPKTLEARIKKMYTDPLKIKLDDRGHPEGCVVCAFHNLYNPDPAPLESACREGRTGCGACKKLLFELMNAQLSGFREKRAALAASADVEAVLAAGAGKAASVAAAKMAAASKAAGL